MSLQKQVQAVLEKVSVHLQGHGGDVELVDVTEDGTVQVRLKKGCQGCPMAKHPGCGGIEGWLKAEIPEVRAVIAVD